MTQGEIKSPAKAIRAKCLDCCGGSANEVRLCTAPNCPLYHFRFGKNPYRTVRILTEEQKVKLHAGLARSKNSEEIIV